MSSEKAKVNLNRKTYCIMKCKYGENELKHMSFHRYVITAYI